MNKQETLEIEAEKYAKSFIEDDGTSEVDFIAGATSSYVQQEKLKFAIEQLNKILDVSASDSDALYNCCIYKDELEKQLKEL